ncbi:Presenilin-2 [Allomyces javanicus]|nr:Presenilin-2 [Allomyces javanicus]
MSSKPAAAASAADQNASARPPGPTASPTVCRVCGKRATSACSQCGPAISYCSQACQLADWPAHAPVCKATAAAPTVPGLPAAAAAATAAATTTTAAHPHHTAHIDASQLPETTVARLHTLGYDPDTAADLLFYTAQVTKLVRPILICILLSIAWTKISMSSQEFRPAGSVWTVYKEDATASSGARLAGGFMNAGIILAQIAVMTVILVLLFKYNCMKIIYGLFSLVLISVLGFTGFLLSLSIINAFRMVIDYVTLGFCLYNFAIVGIVGTFWRAPRFVQQIYLVLISSLMAFALTGLQEWTTWILLALLVLWDLFAVLSPYGPLRALLNTVKERNQNIEMLVYSVGACVWFMSAAPGAPRRPGGSPAAPAALLPGLAPDDAPVPTLSSESEGSLRRLVDANAAGTAAAPPPTAAARVPSTLADAEEDDDDDDDSGLKLGLGDFVFYSVLTARAAMTDWVTTIACIIAVTTGMTMTILLLAITRKALPALPISITFGIVFYLGSAFSLVPFTQMVANQRLLV